MDGLGFNLDNWVRLDWVCVIFTLLNGLLGFKGPIHLISTQTHPFDSSTSYYPKKKKKIESSALKRKILKILLILL